MRASLREGYRERRSSADGANAQPSSNNTQRSKSKNLWKIFAFLCTFTVSSLLFETYQFLVPIREQQRQTPQSRQQYESGLHRPNGGGAGEMKDAFTTPKALLHPTQIIPPEKHVSIATAGKSATSFTENKNFPRKEQLAELVTSSPPPTRPVSYYPELHCGTFGGPNNTDITKDIVYWKEIPTDVEYISPFKDPNQPRYVTFEPDEAGWNNVRMSLENIILFAIATGRTLVLSPKQMFVFMANKGEIYKEQKYKFSFNDFFHLDMLHTKHAGIEIITMKEFLQDVGMTGKLKDRQTGTVIHPPARQTSWDGKPWLPLKKYLRTVGHILDWKPYKCLAAFPATEGQRGVDRLQRTFEQILKQTPYPSPPDFYGKPTPVNASPLQRMREAMGGRKNLCVYDTNLQNEFLIHIKMEMNFEDHKESYRWLAHFYSFLFFENWKVDVWSKRFVRDHVRYRDEIMCAASRIVHFLKERAKSRNPTSNPNGDFYTIHVRRNDFQGQYKATEANGTQILQSCLDHVPIGSTVYIATDEKDLHFFDPFQEVFDLHFLKHFGRFLVDFNTNLYGQVDQIVATQGVKFIGLFYSTYTGYIHRLRGYYSVRDQWPGFEKGELTSDVHYLPPFAVKNMWKYEAIQVPFWFREFPVAWRDIDMGIGSNWDDPWIEIT